MNARFTSFATYKDLVNYIKCLQSGRGTVACYNFGDNGVGARGTVTAQATVPMCALPQSEMKKKWGSVNAAMGKKVKCKLLGKEIEAEVRDIGPSGVCDLNPAALLRLGLSQETELSTPGTWEWL